LYSNKWGLMHSTVPPTLVRLDKASPFFEAIRYFIRSNSLFILTRLCWRGLLPPQQEIQERPRHPRQLPSGRIHRVPVAQDGEAHDAEHGELVGLVEGEGVTGEGGDAEAGEGARARPENSS
jgi:hypothetical protein